MNVYLKEKIMKTVQIYLGKERLIIDARLIETREKSVLVKLPDGNIIIRKNRDIVK